MKIGVIGANTLGVGFSLLCEKAGYDVMIYDENEDTIFNLNNEIFITKEPLIQKMLFESYEFSGTTDVVELIELCDVIFTFVDTTPTLNGGNDTTKVFEISNHFFTLSQLNKPLHNKKFIIGSTLNPGDTGQIQEKLHMFNIQVAYNPAMSSEGNIINGYYNSDVVIIGTEYPELSDILISMYNKIQPNGANIHTMTSKSAEISKLAINAYSSMKICFANTIGDLCNKLNLKEETNLILNTIGKDSRVGNKSFKYGFGYGGDILPRDTTTLLEIVKNNQIDTTLLTSIKDSNDNHLKFLKDYYISQNPYKSIPFYMSSISYKEGISSLVDSQQYKLCIELLDEGYYVNVIDNHNYGLQLQELCTSYNDKLKFFKPGTLPEGYKIN